jgi:hypothetical protein
MKLGTRSTLFGVHHFLLHPFLVWMAWIRLYRSLPTWRESVCILIHDIGYLGCDDMDGDQGSRHPELGASIARRLLGEDERRLVLFHSRFTANQYGEPVSRLCAPDKLVLFLYPAWLYTFLAMLSGESKEYQWRMGLESQPGIPLIHFFRVRAYDWAIASAKDAAERTAVRRAFERQYRNSIQVLRHLQTAAAVPGADAATP